MNIRGAFKSITALHANDQGCEYIVEILGRNKAKLEKK